MVICKAFNGDEPAAEVRSADSLPIIGRYEPLLLSLQSSLSILVHFSGSFPLKENLQAGYLERMHC